MSSLDGFLATLERPGRPPLEVTPIAESLQWGSAAVGGFADCSFACRGIKRRDIPKLSRLRLFWDGAVVYEGQVEDIGLQISAGDIRTTVTAFGLRRVLSETLLRDVWIDRAVEMVRYPGAYDQDGVTVTDGNFDVTDLTRRGFQIAGQGATPDITVTNSRLIYAPAGLTFRRILARNVRGGVLSKEAMILSLQSTGSSTLEYTLVTGTAGSVDVDRALTAGSIGVVLNLTLVSGTPYAASETAAWDRIRVLCQGRVGLDTNDGYYPRTLLLDLISQVPGLVPGIVEDDRSFVIDQFEAASPRTVEDLVKQVATFYSREYGVWEDGRFDWRQPNVNEPQWVATTSELASLDLDESVDGLSKRLVVAYTDAIDGREKTAEATSTSQRNPYVKAGRPKDEVFSPGFSMTPTSASALAARLIAERGSYPAVRGRATIPATSVIRRHGQSPAPAFLIRAGENLLIPDLPPDNPFATGQDGQTLFHVTGADTDLQAGMVTLDLEGQTRRADVLLARLANATRGLAG